MRRNSFVAVWATGALVSLLSMTAGLAAHHSFAGEFDGTKKIVLVGTITKFDRVNPHGWIYLNVKGPDAKVARWAVETGSPAALAAAGVKRESLPIGMLVTVEGFRAKDGSNTISGSNIKLPDGTGLSLGPAAAGI